MRGSVSVWNADRYADVPSALVLVPVFFSIRLSKASQYEGNQAGSGAVT